MGLPRHLLNLFRDAPRKRLLLRSLALSAKGGNHDVTSADGTSLCVRRTGRGTPVVLVHGTSDGIGAFSFVEPVLAEHHEVWVYDRRGRGDSGDGDDYELEREVEDLLAVIAATGATPHVGRPLLRCADRVADSRDHRRGPALPDALRTPLVTEEIPSDAVAEVNAAVERGDHEHAFTTMASQLAGFADEELAVVRAIPPLWDELLETVPTVPRELSAVRSVDWEPDTVPLSDVPVCSIHAAATAVPSTRRSPSRPTTSPTPCWTSSTDTERGTKRRRGRSLGWWLVRRHGSARGPDPWSGAS